MGKDFCCAPPEGPEITEDPPVDQVAHCPSNQQCLAACINSSDPGVLDYYCCFTNSTALPTKTTTTMAPPPGPSCFPSAAKVNLQNGKSVTMSELPIGDQVLAGKESFKTIDKFLFCC